MMLEQLTEARELAMDIVAGEVRPTAASSKKLAKSLLITLERLEEQPRRLPEACAGGCLADRLQPLPDSHSFWFRPARTGGAWPARYNLHWRLDCGCTRVLAVEAREDGHAD